MLDKSPSSVGEGEDAVPVPVVLQGVQDVLGVGVDQVRPGLPQGVHNVVYKTHLNGKYD